MSPDGRRQTLENWAPFPLEIVAEIDGSFELERRFHALFGDLWQGHEWFRWSPELQSVMDDVAAGTFDLSTLPEAAVRKSLIKRRPWTEEQRLRASYSHRIRIAEGRSGRRFGIHIQHVSFDKTWRELIPAIEEYLSASAADPIDTGQRLTRIEAIARSHGEGI